MALAFEELKVRLTGLDSVLGSVALNKEVFSEFMVNKTKTKEEKEAALADLENIEENTEKGTTGFYRDENGKLIMKGYQVKGFLKEAMKALKDQLDIKSYLSKVDNYVFVLERNIPIMRDGVQLEKPDGFLERPLRAETMQGPRVSLARSEEVLCDWYIDLTIRVMKNAGTAKSKPVDMDAIKACLDYGSMKGLLQWRNAGHGTFNWKEVE